MIVLLDVSVLIPLADVQHLHHDLSECWFAKGAVSGFATCAITQLALLRYLTRFHGGIGLKQALAVLGSFAEDARHRFLNCDLAAQDARWFGVIGHAQVTDAYLAALARRHGIKLATLDTGLAAVHGDVAELISA